MTAVTDNMLDLFEAAEAAHTFTHGGDYRRCCHRAGLEAVAPHIAAQALRQAVDEVLTPMHEKSKAYHHRAALSRTIERLQQRADAVDDHPGSCEPACTDVAR